MRPLGKNQVSVLDALIRHGVYPGRWYWTSASVTTRILDSLVKRGLAERIERPSWTEYRPTDAGRAANDQRTRTDEKCGG